MVIVPELKEVVWVSILTPRAGSKRSPGLIGALVFRTHLCRFVWAFHPLGEPVLVK